MSNHILGNTYENPLRDAINSESRKDLMLLESLPYLLAVLRQQESAKLRDLINRVVKETA